MNTREDIFDGFEEFDDQTVYATQGGGYARMVGPIAFFIEELDVPGAYHFNIGDKVPNEWDLAKTQWTLDTFKK